MLSFEAELSSSGESRVESKLVKGFVVKDETITCLRCGTQSHNPNDVANYYCGHCKEFLL